MVAESGISVCAAIVVVGARRGVELEVRMKDESNSACTSGQNLQIYTQTSRML
jgi:hypothetical protein